MLALRVVKRLLRTMTHRPEEVAEPSDGALGDWYVNGRVLDGVPLLIMISSASLLAMVVEARKLPNLPARFPGLLTRRLKRLGAPDRLIEAEVAAARPVRVARTTDRLAINSLIRFNREFSNHLWPINRWDSTSLPVAERRLGEELRKIGGPESEYIYPAEIALELLHARWKKQAKNLSP